MLVAVESELGTEGVTPCFVAVYESKEWNKRHRRQVMIGLYKRVAGRQMLAVEERKERERVDAKL